MKILATLICLYITSLSAQNFDNISWHRKVGVNNLTSSVSMSDVECRNTRFTYQIGDFKGFSNFNNQALSNLIIPANTTSLQGYLARYNSADGNLDSVLTFESSYPINLYSIDTDSITGKIVISGHFKNSMTIADSLIVSPHPLTSITGFLMILDSAPITLRQGGQERLPS